MNQFEKYIKDKKDSLQPEPKENFELWYRIESELKHKKQIKTRRIVSIAASLALIISSVTFIKVYFFSNQPMDYPLYSYSDFYGNIEKEFTNAISYQEQQVRVIRVSADQKELFDAFIVELKALDKTYNQYLEIVKKDGYNEIMIELIIKYYQQKLEVLETLHQELIKLKNYETDKNIEQTSLDI